MGTALVARRIAGNPRVQETTEEREALEKIDALQRQLRNMTQLPEVRAAVNEAAAIGHLVKRMRWGLKLQNRCAHLKFAAERRAGIVLGEVGLLKGRPRKGHSPNTLSSMGVTHNEAQRWRATAKLSADDLERRRQECDDAEVEFTRVILNRIIKTRAPEAYWDVRRPWENHWSEHPDDKRRLQAFLRLSSFLSAAAATDSEIRDALRELCTERDYLHRHEVQQLRDLFETLRDMAQQGLDGMQRRLDGRAPAGAEQSGPTLLDLIRGA